MIVLQANYARTISMDSDGYAVSLLRGRVIFDKQTTKDEIRKWFIEITLQSAPRGYMIVHQESSIGLYDNELFYKVKYKETVTK